MENELHISFGAISAAEAGRRAAELESFLRTSVPGIRIERLRENRESMDAGTILAVVLGSAAVVELAKGLTIWLSKRQGTELTFKDKNGEVKAAHVTSADAVKIISMLKG